MDRSASRAAGTAAIAVVAVLALAAGTAYAQAQAPAPVSLDVRDSYRLTVDNAPTTIVIPVNAANGVTLEKVQSSVVGVDQATATALASFFVAVVDSKQINLTVGKAGSGSSTSFPRPGTYQIRLELPWKQDPVDAAVTVKSPTVSIVKIEIPTAVISTTSKLEVRQRVVCFFDRLCAGDPHTQAEALVARETSGSASGGHLNVSAVDATTPDQGPPVTIMSAGGDVGRGGSAEIPYSVSGDIATGTAQATLNLTGDRLAAAAATEVTVIRRQSGWTFAVLVGLGLILGWIGRNQIRDRVARRDALSLYNRARVKLLDARQKSADSQLWSEIDAIIVALDAAAAPSSTAPIAEAITKAEADLVATGALYGVRLAKVRTERAEFASTLETLGFAPLAAERERAIGGLAPVDQAIAQGNATQAQHVLDALQEPTSEDFVKGTRTWATGLSGIIATFDDPSITGAVPAQALDVLGDRVELLQTLNSAQQVGWDQLPPTLLQLSNAEKTLCHLLAVTVGVAAAIEERAPEQYRDSDLEPALKGLRNLVTARALAGGPDAAERLGLAIDRTLVAWIADVGNATATTARLERRFYEALLALEGHELPERDSAQPDPRLRMLGGESDTEGVDDRAAPPIPATIGPPTPPPQPAGLTPNPTSTTALKVIIWIAAAMSFVGAAYVLLPATMLGTPLQQAGVLLWATAVPPTVDGLVGQLSKLAPGPAK